VANGDHRWEGVVMKYVVTWEGRANNSEELQARSLQVFSNWSPAPGNNFLQFVGRVDGRGGFAVVETDDVTLVARDMAIFGTFFEMSVYPVLDIQESTGIAAGAVEFRSGIG
jgi:Protein of unknown function (DUF3303)